MNNFANISNLTEIKIEEEENPSHLATKETHHEENRIKKTEETDMSKEETYVSKYGKEFAR
jgi:hypothetical protein